MADTERSRLTSSRRLPPISPGQLFALVLAVLAVVFIAQNRERVRIAFFTIEVSAPVWLMLTVMVSVGIVIGALLRRRR